MVRGERPPYLVHFIVGDPDSGDALVFKRVSPSSNRTQDRPDAMSLHNVEGESVCREVMAGQPALP
jgi:hypothetical protein